MEKEKTASNETKITDELLIK